MVWHVPVRLGKVWLGAVWQARYGTVCCGLVSYGSVRSVLVR